MAHNSRIRSFGFWVMGVLDPAEMELFDAGLFKCINGDDGGTWAPTDPIVIGGDGIEVSGGLLISGFTTAVCQPAFNFEGNVAFGTSGVVAINFTADTIVTVDAGSTWSFDGDFSQTAGLFSLAGSSVYLGPTTPFDADGDIRILSGAVLQVQAGATLQVQAGATCTLASATTISGALTLSGATTRSASLTKSGASAREINRTTVLPANTNATVDVASDIYTIVHNLPATITLTARRTTAPVPSDGEIIRFVVDIPGGLNIVNLVNETSGTNIVTMSGAVGAIFRLAIFCIGGTWRLLYAYNNAGTLTPGAAA